MAAEAVPAARRVVITQVALVAAAARRSSNLAGLPINGACSLATAKV
jgi:hypothetical protein